MSRPQLDQSRLHRRVPFAIYSEALLHFDGLRIDRAIELLRRATREATALAAADQSVPASTCQLLLAQCHLWNGELSLAKETASALDDSVRQRDELSCGWLVESILALAEGRYREGRDRVDAVIRDRLAVRDFDLCEPLLYRGSFSLRLGDLAEAEADFENGHALADLQRSLRLQAGHANFLGFVHLATGRYRAAIHWYERARAIGLATEQDLQIGIAALNLGICSYRLGDYDAALDHLRTALAHLETPNASLNLCRTHIALANVHRWLRDFATARGHLTSAYAMAGDLGAAREECLALEFLGDVLRDEGKPAEARRYYRRGAAIAATIAPDGDLVLELLRREGECFVREGRTDRGLETLARALSRARKLGDRPEEGVVQRCLAEGFLRSGDLATALTYAEQACALLAELEMRHEHAIARLVAAEILWQRSHDDAAGSPRESLDRAWNQTVIAQEIVLKLGVAYWADAVGDLQRRIARRRQEDLRLRCLAAPPTPSRSGESDGGATPRTQVIIAASNAMRDVLQTAAAYAAYAKAVLVTGETGTGKELIARLLHLQSDRAERKLVTVNIAAIPQTMFDRELFGHVRGAFSGADRDGRGLAAAADGGTLLLDEIGELSRASQVKLLRLLQDGSYLQLGDPTQRYADLRIIAVTNRDLYRAMQEGRFRKDLYYRLCELTIHIPPLRERPQDILPLLRHFLGVVAGREVAVDGYFNAPSRRVLERYDWPGNVREVMQIAHRAHDGLQRQGRVDMMLGEGRGSLRLSGPGAQAAPSIAAGASRPLSRAHVLLALDESGGNRAEAARRLGISRGALYRRLEKFGIEAHGLPAESN